MTGEKLEVTNAESGERCPLHMWLDLRNHRPDDKELLFAAAPAKKFPVHGVDRTFPAAEAVQKDNQSLQEANGQRRHEKILHECAKALASGP